MNQYAVRVLISAGKNIKQTITHEITVPNLTAAIIHARKLLDTRRNEGPDGSAWDQWEVSVPSKFGGIRVNIAHGDQHGVIRRLADIPAPRVPGAAS